MEKKASHLTAASAFSGILSILGLGFAVLNTLGGVVSGVWLALLGRWTAIGLGILGIFISHFLISIALMPSFALGAGGFAAAKRGSRLGMLIFALLSNLYIAAILTGWSLGVLTIFLSMAESSSSLIPLLIWSYGVALGPWQFLASKDAQSGSGEAATQTTFFGQIAYVLVILLILLTEPSFQTAAIVFISVMLANVFLQLFIVGLTSDELVADVEVDGSPWPL